MNSTDAIRKLQNELVQIKQLYKDNVKLRKAPKDIEGYPFPISVKYFVELEERASAIDLDSVALEILILDKIVTDDFVNQDNLYQKKVDDKLSIRLLLDQGTPSALNDEVRRRLMDYWKKIQQKRKSREDVQQEEDSFGIQALLQYFESNVFELLTCVPFQIETYEGTDVNGITVRRYVILQDQQQSVQIESQRNADPGLLEKRDCLDQLNGEVKKIATWLQNVYGATIVLQNESESSESRGVLFELVLRPTDPKWPCEEVVDGIVVNGQIRYNGEQQVQIIQGNNDTSQLSPALIRVFNKAVERHSTRFKDGASVKETLKFLENYAGELYSMVKQKEDLEQSKRAFVAKASKDIHEPVGDDEGVSTDQESEYEDSEVYSECSEGNGSLGYSEGDEQEETVSKMQSVQIVPGERKRFLVELENLKLDNVDVVQPLQIQLQVGCERCGQSQSVKLSSSAVDSSQASNSKQKADTVSVAEQCEQCHLVGQIQCQFRMVHESSALIASVETVGCFPVDLLPSMMAVQCTECGQQTALREMQVGQVGSKECRSCHKKCELEFKSVTFHLVKESNSERKKSKPKSSYPERHKGGKKAPQFNGVLKKGEPLPATGTCKHYHHSHRWYRFPCCGQRFPCDLCHEENTDGHEMKWAARMVCGYCSTEQKLAQTCVECNKRLANGASHPQGRNTQFWEGGKGCRDPRKMHGKDPRKYKNSKLKTSSKKQQRVGQSGGHRRQRGQWRESQTQNQD